MQPQISCSLSAQFSNQYQIIDVNLLEENNE